MGGFILLFTIIYNMSHYVIANENEKFFLNLCGHYSLVDEAADATVWDDPNHKEMWFYLHELKASTNRNWYVIDLDNVCHAMIGGHHHVDESEDARTFECWLTGTIENVEKTITVEKETFNEFYRGKKFIPDMIWATHLLLKGTTKYILIAETKDGYFRYKNSVRDLRDTNERMWLW